MQQKCFYMQENENKIIGHHKGFDPKTKLWWGLYKQNSPAFLYDLEFMDGTIKRLVGRVYSPIYKNGTQRFFFDHYENGKYVNWVPRFNKVFETDFKTMDQVKEYIKDKNGRFGDFVYWYASRYMPEVKSWRIISTPEYPVRKKRGKRKFWSK